MLVWWWWKEEPSYISTGAFLNVRIPRMVKPLRKEGKCVCRLSASQLELLTGPIGMRMSSSLSDLR